MTNRTTTDAGQDTPGRRPPRLRLPRGRRGRLIAVLAALAVVLLAVTGDIAVLSSRVRHLHVDLSSRDGDGSTWVLIGLDSRADLPAGASVADFGTTDAVPGARADVVVVVHRTASGTQVISVPRDVVTTSAHGTSRLTLSWLSGPASTVRALCGLGIPTDHLVTVDLGGFAAMVDAAGGVEVDVPEPVRDPPAGLLVTHAGRQRVDGATALALVRSRHPEHLVGGVWTPAPVDPDGRATEAGAVLRALAGQVRHSVSRPWRLQSEAWAASGAVSVDEGTSPTDLASLARTDLGAVQVLPVGPPLGTSYARLPTQATRDTIRAAGMSCTR
jgi:LCP family protein required for cell wall assembly